MKKVLLLAFGLTLCAGAAMADHIGLYNEITGVNCFRAAAWNPLGSNFVYVIQKLNSGSQASEFKVNNLSGAPYSSFTVPVMVPVFSAIGDPMTGVSIAYGACVVGDLYAMRIRFADDFETGEAPTPCGKLEVVPDPQAVPPVLQTVDCLGLPKPATGGVFYFGTNCGGCGEPTATERATWGSIKALYR